MAAEYKIFVKNRAGTVVDQFVNFNDLMYVKEVNSPGLLTFTVNENHNVIPLLERDGQVEVWRKDAAVALDWYCDFYGLYIEDERQANDDGVTTFVAYCVGQMDFLRRSIVAYPDDTVDRSSFTTQSSERIAKTLVTRNATSSGTTGDGRLRNVDSWGANISVEADANQGSLRDYKCAWKQLLTALQEVAANNEGDFDLVKTGAQAWEFRWYNGHSGTDRSATVKFALNLGNMLRPRLTRNKMREATVGIVGGQDDGTGRDYAIVTGANYQALYNSSETFINGGQFDTTDGLTAFGTMMLSGVQSRNSLDFIALQTKSTYYGLHYFLGDRVTARYQDVEETKKIVRVQVSLRAAQSSRNEDIKVDMVSIDEA